MQISVILPCADSLISFFREIFSPLYSMRLFPPGSASYSLVSFFMSLFPLGPYKPLFSQDSACGNFVLSFGVFIQGNSFSSFDFIISMTPEFFSILDFHLDINSLFYLKFRMYKSRYIRDANHFLLFSHTVPAE